MSGEEKTIYKALSCNGFTGGGNPCAVDVKNGRIVRVRPLHYDSKYTKDQITPGRFRGMARLLNCL